MNVYPTAQRVVSGLRLRGSNCQCRTAQLAEETGCSQLACQLAVSSTKNGLEAIWNHNVRWRGQRVSGRMDPPR
jgi:hypothetical protein